MAKHYTPILTTLCCVLAAAACFTSACKKKNEDPPPSYDFTWSADPAVGTPVTFTSNAPETDKHYWDFGFGNISTDARPTHIFGRSGEMYVSLMVNDDIAYSVTKSIWVSYLLEIHRGGSVIAGDTTWFKSNTVPGTHSWLWNFGDGHTSALPQPPHVYKKGGTYQVSLEIDGGKQSASMSVTIFNDPVYTPKLEGSRLWHIHKRVESPGVNYTYDTDTSFLITYLNKIAVSINNEFFKGQFRYNEQRSGNGILVYDGPKTTLRYDPAVDTACLLYEYKSIYDSVNWWNETIIGRTP